MKICPQCSFQNDERLPTCAFCNAIIVDVAPAEEIAPGAGESLQRAIFKSRRKLHRGQIRGAAMLYAGFITVTACCPGFVFNPLVLALYALSALFVVTLIRWGIVGQLSASVVQGALSVTLLIVFGPMLPLLPLMLIGHVALPAIFWHWTAMIDDAHR